MVSSVDSRPSIAELNQIMDASSTAQFARVLSRYAQRPDDLRGRLLEACESGSVTDIEDAAVRAADLPDDLLALIGDIVAAQPRGRLSTRQKKGLCRAFEHYATTSIARAIGCASRSKRRLLNHLSVKRFGGDKLKGALEQCASGETCSWEREVDQRLEDARNAWVRSHMTEQESCPEYRALFDVLGERPHELLLALPHVTSRIGHLPKEAEETILEHCACLSAPELVGALTSICEGRTLLETAPSRRHGLALMQVGTRFGSPSVSPRELRMAPHAIRPEILLRTAIGSLGDPRENEGNWATADPELVRLVRDGATTGVEWDRFWSRRKLSSAVQTLLRNRLAEVDTPLRGRRVHLDTSGVELDRSVVLADRWGYAGGTWPASGMAFELPESGQVRLYATWRKPEAQSDATVPFLLTSPRGGRLWHPYADAWEQQDDALWDVRPKVVVDSGLSGGTEEGRNGLRHLTIDLDKARRHNVGYVVMGRCVSKNDLRRRMERQANAKVLVLGAPLEDRPDTRPIVHAFKSIDMEIGDSPACIIVDVTHRYLQIQRSSEVPLGGSGFSLRDYLFALFDAQECTLVDDPSEAEVRACIGPSDDLSVVSLFDSRFFL